MPLQLDDLGLLEAPTASDGQPLQLPIESIDEDPDQPRQEFGGESLKELASTIAEGGVRSPISVRPHPEAPGRWILNFGARRLRASKLAGRADIPVFVDRSADAYDQVIENEQREGLKPLELALFIQRRLTVGESQAEIARRMGKGRAYVSYACALIDAPAWLMSAYREGRCRGLRELYELRRLHEQSPQRVQAWAEATTAMTRDHVAALKAELAPDGLCGAAIEATPARAVRDVGIAESPNVGNERAATPTRRSPVLVAELEGVTVQLVVNDVPAQRGAVFVRTLGTTSKQVVGAERLKLIGFLDP